MKPPVNLPSEPRDAVRDRARGRVQLVAGVLACLMTVSAARGMQIAVSPRSETLQIATDKRWASVVTQGPRGELRTSDGAVLAKSVRSPAIFLDPVRWREALEADPSVVESDLRAELSAVLGMPEPELLVALGSARRYVRLAREVHPSVADALKDAGLTKHGVIIEENFRRYYPQGTIAGQLMGFLDDAGHGVQGVEASLDDLLSGGALVAQRRVNRKGDVLELDTRDDRGIHGMTVELTLDLELQRATEMALAGVLERSDPVWASAAVVEVKTGRVLAMATAPTFDPNNLAGQPFDVTRNRAVSDPVEPGSVFKSFTYAAALEEGVTRPDEIIATPSPFSVGGASIRDDHPHPRLAAWEIVKYSSNVGSAQLSHRLGSKRMLAYLEAFGFGAPTGVQTSHEEAGRRSPSRVGPVELATISYGQGTTATVLQLAMGTATLANGGVRMKPMLVDRVLDGYGEVRQVYEPTVLRRVVSEDTALKVREAMEHVTDLDATAPKARIPGYRVGGKTGTSYKVVKGAYSSSARYAVFIGFAPVSDPDLAMVILVDEPRVGSRYGGVVAAPVFAEVIGPALQRRGIAPDMPDTLPKPSGGVQGLPADTAAPPIVAEWLGDGWRMPDLLGRDTRSALAGLQGVAAEVEVSGSGFLVRQEPASGSLVQPGQAVSLWFAGEPDQQP